MPTGQPVDGKGLPRWLRDYFPFGLLHANKPRHFRDILKTVVDNAGQLGDAWRVLNGPCNGCALQTDGLRDNVIPDSPHFCLTRLGLIEETLRRSFDPRRLADLIALSDWPNEDIEHLGRIPVPLVRRRGDRGFAALSYEEAYDLAAEWMRRFRGDRMGFFTTSKGINNEEYFAFQQFARVVGQTNNVDSCARQCHAASVAALKATLGVGAASGSLSDFIEADVLVLAGTNLANNQPLALRYLEQGKRTRGGRPRVIVVNSYREPGLERYWVPSSPGSALFGTRIADLFVQVRVGGDVAFFNGVMKCLVEENLLGEHHRRFIGERTAGFAELVGALGTQSFEFLSEQSGVSRRQMREVATILADCDKATFVWGMGLTQHATGSDNVKAVVHLALALGQLGRPGAGVVPLRGQSSVQSAGECGVAPNIFPGGEPIKEETARRFSDWWGAPVPARPGLATGPMIEAAERGEIKLLVCVGGNLLDTMPDRRFVRRALEKTAYRIRFDVMMNRDALIEPGEAILVLPVRNWYEWQHVFTTTSTDRTIRAFGPSIGPRVRQAPELWQALRQIALRVLGGTGRGFAYENTDDIRREMDRSIWMYRGIATLNQPHAQMQWGGPCLYANGFEQMPGGRARFWPLRPAAAELPEGYFMVSTRRGWGQWNSQHRRDTPRDYMTGATSRSDVLMNPQDVDRLALADGRRIRLVSDHGTAMPGTCRPDPAVRPRHLQVFWPAANDLIPHGVYDAGSCEPDYNVAVRIEPV